MTTPAPVAPTLTITTDQAIYAPGDTVTLTATYVDANGTLITIGVAAQAVDNNTPPNTATAATSFQVGIAAEEMTVTVTDTAGDVYAPVPASTVLGTAVFTTTAPAAA
jgi:hypothetical protein